MKKLIIAATLLCVGVLIFATRYSSTLNWRRVDTGKEAYKKYYDTKTSDVSISPFAPYVTPLEDFDRKAYFVCKALENSWPFTRKGTRFFVGTNRAGILRLSLLVGLTSAWTVRDPDGGVRNEVYFWPKTLKEKAFKGIVAHELGHIEEQDSNDLVADAFAKKMLTLRREEIGNLIDFLRKVGMDKSHPRIIALSN